MSDISKLIRKDPIDAVLADAPRVSAIRDPQATDLVRRLMRLALRGLPQMYRGEPGEFAFTRVAATSDAGAAAELRGTSARYGAMVALGLHWLPEAVRRPMLGQRSPADLLTDLVGRIGPGTDLGDAAVICWAAAQAAHPRLDRALDWLARLDAPRCPRSVVQAAWVVSALTAARDLADVEEHLSRARSRLLGSRRTGSPLFAHATGPGLVRWARGHVCCFADQVYPIQALARLHRSVDDPVALAAAEASAAAICRAQGSGGQWWWHYDARTGEVIEGYPVYSVHQHAMAPMALLDLAEAGGADHDEAIRRGLAWLAAPPELAGPASADPAAGMIADEYAMTWRKVFRGDPGKLVRRVHAAGSWLVPGARVPGIDRVFRPTSVDRECRPYELGLFLFAWLGRSAAREAAPTGMGPKTR